MSKKMKRETRPRGYGQYHIRYSPPNDVWPNGGWSVYRIDGDTIARSVIWEDYNVKDGCPIGKVKFRHSWPGYLGMVETFEGAKALIDMDAAEVVTFVTEDT